MTQKFFKIIKLTRVLYKNYYTIGPNVSPTVSMTCPYVSTLCPCPCPKVKLVGKSTDARNGLLDTNPHMSDTCSQPFLTCPCFLGLVSSIEFFLCCKKNWIKSNYFQLIFGTNLSTKTFLFVFLVIVLLGGSIQLNVWDLVVF